MSGRGEWQYEGAIITVIDEADAEGGITLAEFGWGYLRLELDAEAAAQIEDDSVLVEFDLDDSEFARLQGELVEMFAGVGVLRLPEAAPDYP